MQRNCVYGMSRADSMIAQSWVQYIKPFQSRQSIQRTFLWYGIYCLTPLWINWPMKTWKSKETKRVMIELEKEDLCMNSVINNTNISTHLQITFQ